MHLGHPKEAPDWGHVFEYYVGWLFETYATPAFNTVYLAPKYIDDPNRKICDVIHGARSAVLRVKRERSPFGPWLDRLETRAPINVVVTAAANKLARIAWAVLSSGRDYRAAVNSVAA